MRERTAGSRQLTEQQRTVLRLLAEGRTRVEVAETLGSSKAEIAAIEAAGTELVAEHIAELPAHQLAELAAIANGSPHAKRARARDAAWGFAPVTTLTTTPGPRKTPCSGRPRVRRTVRRRAACRSPDGEGSGSDGPGESRATTTIAAGLA